MKLSGISTAGLLASSLFLSTAAAPLQSFVVPAAAETAFIDILPLQELQTPVSDWLNGINCEDPSNVWVSLYKNATLIKIDKEYRTIQGYYDAKDTPQQRALPSKFYGVVRDPTTGNIFVNEESGIRLWRFNPDTNEWSSTPLIRNLDIPDNHKLSYAKSYEITPNTVKVDEKPSKHGIRTYKINVTSSRDAIAFAKGYVWLGSSHSIDFDVHAENFAGVRDYSFSGLLKIHPYSLAITRITLPGGISPSFLYVDDIDSILWIGEQNANKIYKFDLTTQRVEQIIEITAIPDIDYESLATDENFVYVSAGEHDGNNSTNSRIIRISKQYPSIQTLLDTGARNTSYGTNAVFVLNGTNSTNSDILLWSDGSNHTGSINVRTLARSYNNNTSNSTSYHYGCFSDSSEFWFTMINSSRLGVSDMEFNDATKFRISSYGKVKSNNDAVKIIEATLIGDILCDSDDKIMVKPDTLRGTIRIGHAKERSYYASLTQVNGTSFAFVVTDGQWGKIIGKATFPKEVDCANAIGTSLRTHNNEMVLFRYSMIYNLMNTTDNTIISFS